MALGVWRHAVGGFLPRGLIYEIKERISKVLRYHYLLAIITYVQTVSANSVLVFSLEVVVALFQMNRARNGLLQSSINYVYLIHVGWWPRKGLTQPA